MLAHQLCWGRRRSYVETDAGCVASVESNEARYEWHDVFAVTIKMNLYTVRGKQGCKRAVHAHARRLEAVDGLRCMAYLTELGYKQDRERGAFAMAHNDGGR